MGSQTLIDYLQVMLSYFSLSTSNTSNLCFIFVYSVILIWSGWYIWSFKLSSWFYPSDAPTYPYIIPGHAKDYFENSHELIARARRYFSNSRRPFAIVLAGVRHYVVTSPEDAHIVYSKTWLFNFDYFLSKALSGFGVSSMRLDAFWKERPRSERNPSGKCLVHVTEDIYKRYLLPGPNLSSLTNSHKSALSFCLSFQQLACRCGLSNSVETEPISLYILCTSLMIDSVQACLFDPVIASIDPGMATDLMEFTDDLWKLMHPTPFVDSSRPKSILKRYHDALKKYQKLPKSMRSRESSLLDNLISQYQEYEIHEDDSAAVLVMVYWAAVSNIAKLPYWMLVNILLDDILCATIQNEILPAMCGDEVDSGYLLHECPVLKSVYLETLRLTKMDHSYRLLEDDIEMGGTTLRKGGTVILSVTELHRIQDIFGTNTTAFDHTRFLNGPKLAKSKGFRPFGSGSAYCPGREFAYQQTMLFVALMLHKFDVHIVGVPERPQLDQHLLTVGLSRPVPGTDMQVSLQARTLKVV